MIHLTGSGPSWTVPAARVTEYSGLDASSGPSWFIPSSQLPATPAPSVPARARPQPESDQARPVRQPVLMAAYLERLGVRTAAVGSVLCLGLDPDPERLPPGFPAAWPASRGCAPPPGGGRRMPPRSSPTWPSSRPSGRPDWRPWNGSGRPSRRPAGRGRRQAGRHRLDGAAPGRRPVRRPRGRRDHGQSVRRPRASPRSWNGADRFTYVLCRTSNPGSDELQGLLVGDAPGQPAEPLYERVARRVAGWGPGGTVGLVAGATAPPSWPGSGRSHRAWACSCRASERRAARSDRSSSTGRPRPHRATPGRVAGCSSTSRGGSPGRPSNGPPASPPIRASGSPRPPGIGRPLWRCPCYRKFRS